MVPPGDPPYVVLAALLGEHHVAGLLAGLEQASVLHAAVELAVHTEVGPGEVGDRDQSAVVVADLVLEQGSWQPHHPEQVAPAGLADRLAETVEEAEGDLEAEGAGHPVETCLGRPDLVGGGQTLVQHPVADDHPRLGREQREGLDDGARRRRDLPAVALDDVALYELRAVVGDARLVARPRVVASREVDPLERHAPQRCAVRRERRGVREGDVAAGQLVGRVGPREESLGIGHLAPDLGVAVGALADADEELAANTALEHLVSRAGRAGLAPQEEAAGLGEVAQRVHLPSIGQRAALRERLGVVPVDDGVTNPPCGRFAGRGPGATRHFRTELATFEMVVLGAVTHKPRVNS